MGRTQRFGQSLDMSLPSPSSPCAHSEADEDVPQADDADDAEAVVSDAAPVEDDNTGPTPLLVSFAKDYFVIKPEHIRFDRNAPFKADSGSSMFALHDSKSFKMWSEKHVIRPRHIIKAVADGQCGWYIRFCVEGSPSDDGRVARAVHKQIAKRFFDLWNKEWPLERKEKYAELLRDEPSDTKQISPDRVGWKQVYPNESLYPNEILYERPKGKKKESDAPLQGAIVKVGGKAGKNKLAKLPVVDDDDQSSAAASAPTATPDDTAIVGFRQPSAQMAMGSAPNIFLQTPGALLTHEHARTPLTLPFGTISQAWSPSRRAICSSSSRISARALERRRQGGGERGGGMSRVGPVLVLAGTALSAASIAKWGVGASCAWRVGYEPKSRAFGIWSLIYPTTVLFSFLQLGQPVFDVWVGALWAASWLFCAVWVPLFDASSSASLIGAAIAISAAAGCATAATWRADAWRQPRGALGLPLSLLAGWLLTAASIGIGIAIQANAPDASHTCVRIVPVQDETLREFRLRRRAAYREAARQAPVRDSIVPVFLAAGAAALAAGAREPVLPLPVVWAVINLKVFPSVRSTAAILVCFCGIVGSALRLFYE